jgi:hypothetical protein
MLLYQLRHQQRRSALHPFQRPVPRNFARFQQIHYAKKFAFGQDLQLSTMQIPLENRTYLEPASEPVSPQRQMQANHLMLRLSDFTQRLQQQTTDLLSMQKADRALLAEQISQELSEFHTNLTTVIAALRYMSQQQNHEQFQSMHDLADFIAFSQAEVKNKLIELSLIRKAQSRQVQQMLQSSPDRCLADTAELLADLQSFCKELSCISPATDSASTRSDPAG